VRVPDAHRADILLGFVPYSVFALGGGAYTNGLWDNDDLGPVEFPIPLVTMSVKSEVANLPAIAHEVGHVFGLEHVPTLNTVTQRERLCATDGVSRVSGVGAVVAGVSIQGFRIAANAGDGANKSTVDGNAESTLGLLPLMFPCQGAKGPIYVSKNTSFISDAGYQQLLDNMGRYQKSGLFTAGRHRVPLMLAANTATKTAIPASNRALGEALAAARPQARGLVVAGALNPDGGAQINWVRGYSGHPRTPADHGDWRLEAIGADGDFLAQQRFTLLADDAGEAFFRVAIDNAQAANTIRLYYRDAPIAALARSEHAPQASITSVTPVGSDRLYISWTSRDTDGDTLTHRLLYAPSQRGPWIALTGRDPSQSLTVERAPLSPGESPTLKLITSDGFNETTTTRPIRETSSLRVLAHAPAGEADPVQVAASEDAIYAVFNTELAAGAISAQTLTLEDPSGEPIPATVKYRSIEHMAVLSPEQELNPGTAYTVSLAPEIADRYGHTLGKSLSWRFILQPEIETRATLSSNADATDKAATTQTPPSQAEQPGAEAETMQGRLELAGERLDFRIEKCSRQNTQFTGDTINLSGHGPDGMRITVAAMTLPGRPPVQRAIIQTGATPPAFYFAARRKMDAGWADAHGEPAGGPLIQIDGTRLTVATVLVARNRQDRLDAVITADCLDPAAMRDNP